MKVTIAQPQAIVLDFLSTAIKAGFIEKGLFAYLRKHGKEYIEQKWATKEFKDLLTAVRRQTRRDLRSNDAIPKLAEQTEPLEAQQEALWQNILWGLDNHHETAAHYKMKFAIYEDGYEKGKLTTHVYTDVAKNMKKWNEMGIKLFIYSNAWSKSQEVFMKQTNHGNLFDLINGFYDTTGIGEPTDSNSFVKLLEKIGLPANDVVYLTKGVNEGRAAKAAGVHAILVISHQHQMKKYDPNDLSSFERLRSFDELSFKGQEDQGGASNPEPEQEAQGGGQEGGSESSETPAE